MIHVKSKVKDTKNGKVGIVKRVYGEVVAVEQTHTSGIKLPRGYRCPIYITIMRNLELSL